MPVNIGSIEGTIKLTDELTGPLSKAGDKLNNFASNIIARASSSIKSASSSIQQSLGGISTKVKSTIADLEKSSQAITKVGRQMSDVGGQLSRTLTVPLAAVGGFATKAAIDFESSFAGVRKTVNATEAEFAALSKGIRELAAGPKPIPINVNELNAVAEAAGQLGIAKNDILAFTKTMADLGQTTNLSADEAATATAQYQAIFGEAGKNVDRFGATLVALGNDGASTERQILEMGLRIAGAGNQIGLTQGQVLAFASALSSVGIDAEAGGSAISKVMINMALATSKGGVELRNFAGIAGMSSAEFKRAFKDDAAGAVTSFIEGLGRLKAAGGDVLGALDTMGITEVRMRDTLLRAAGAGDILTRSLELQDKAWQENTALTREAEQRYKTFESQLKITWNRIRDVAITVGTSLLPVFRDLLTVVEPILRKLADMAKWFSELPQPIRMTVVVTGTLLAALGPVVFVLGQLVTAFGAVAGVAPAIIGAIRSIGLAFSGLPAIILGVGLVLNQFISQWKQSMADATAAMFNFQGEAGKFIDTRAKLVEAQKSGIIDIGTLQAAAEQVGAIRRNIEQLNKSLPAAQSKVNAQLLPGKVKQDAQERVGIIKQDIEMQKLRLKELEKQIDAAKKLKLVTGGSSSGGGGTVPKAPPMAPIAPIKAITNDQINQLKTLRDEQAETARYLAEQAALAAKGPGLDLITRLKEEQRINDEHEKRLSILRYESQYGVTIAKSLADQEDKIRKMTRKVAIDLQVSTKIDPIDLSSIISSEFTGSMTKAKADLDAIAQVESANAEAFRKQQEDVLQFWESFAADVKDSFKTTRDIINDQMGAIKYAVQEGFLSASEGEKALWQLRQEQLTQTLDDWQTFFGFLGNLFGGLAQQIASALGNIQSAYQQGKKLDASGFGGSMSGAFGMIFAEIQIFYEIYKLVDGLIEKKKAHKWSDVTSLTMVEGEFNSPNYYNEFGRQFNNSLRSLIDQVVTSIGAVLQEMPQIVVRARKDGKQFSAYVAGVFLGVFNDAQSAMEEAVSYALTNATFRGLGPEMQRALEASIGKTLDELQANIEIATTARNMRLGSVGSAYVDRMNWFNQEIVAMRQLGLATEEMIAARKRETEATINSALGVDTTTSDKLRDLASLNKGIAEAAEGLRGSYQQEIDAIMRQIAALQKPTFTGGVGGVAGGGVPGEGVQQADTGVSWLAEMDEAVDSELANLQRSLQRYIDELDKIPQALSDQQINMGIFDALYKYLEGNRKYAADAVKYAKMKVEIEFATIKAQLMVLGKWEEFAGMFTDAYNAAMAAAGNAGKGGGGRGSSNRDGVRSFIADKTAELATAGMSEYQKQLRELNKQYEEQIKAAGKSAETIAQLNQLRQREIELINTQQIKDTVGSFQQFINGSNQFVEIRKTAEGVIKSIQESPLGDSRKANMIGRVMKALNDQLVKLSQQAAVGLLGEMSQDLEKFGASEELMLQVRQQQAIIEHTLKMAHYAAEIEILKAQGRLAPEVLKTLDDAFKFLQGIDPTKFLPGGSGSSTGKSSVSAGFDRMQKETEDYATAIKSALDSLRKHQEDVTDPFIKSLRDLNEEFISIRKVLGNTPQVVETFNKAVQRTVDQYLKPIADSQRDLFYGDNSPANAEQQWAAIRQQQLDIMDRFNLGDLSVLQDIPDFGGQLLDIAAEISPRGSQGFKSIYDGWNNFLSEVQRATPNMATNVAMGTAMNPMSVAGIMDLTDIGEAQVDRLDMIYAQTYRGAAATEALLDRYPTGGGLTGVL